METDGGSLNFDDLMDNAEDSFPGFGIEKFSAINDTANEKNDILQTPEHSDDEGDVDDALSKHSDGINGVKKGVDIEIGHIDNMETDENEERTGSITVGKVIGNENNLNAENLDDGGGHSDDNADDDEANSDQIDNDDGQSNDEDDVENVASLSTDEENKLLEDEFDADHADRQSNCEVENVEAVDNESASDNEMEAEAVDSINDNSVSSSHGEEDDKSNSEENDNDNQDSDNADEEAVNVTADNEEEIVNDNEEPVGLSDGDDEKSADDNDKDGEEPVNDHDECAGNNDKESVSNDNEGNSDDEEDVEEKNNKVMECDGNNDKESVSNDNEGNSDEDEDVEERNNKVMECDDFVVTQNTDDSDEVTQNTDDSDEETESVDVKPDVVADGGTNEENTSQQVKDEPMEPAPKKARMYLQPPKQKMKLWTSAKSQVKEEVGTSPSKKEKKSSRAGAGVANGTDVKEEPQQQSFLSFLNLQPGSAKLDDERKKLAKKQEKEFYSRKRLRTRKAVSYVEDVPADNSDEDYEGDGDEEEPADHQFIDERTPTTPHRRRTSPGDKGTFSIKTFAQAYTGASPQTVAAPVVTPRPSPVVPVIQPRPQPRVLAPKIIPSPQTNVNTTTVNQPVAINNRSLLNSNVKGLFECGLCGVFFNTASQFISHQNGEHSEETKSGKSAMESFRCEICQFVLTNRFAYLEHKRMKHTKQQFHFSCTKCPKTFNYLLDLQKHKQSCTGKSIWLNCQQCPAKYTNVADFQVHQQTVHSGAKFYCQNKQCNFKCATQNELKLHVQAMHMISELFPCNAPKCARIFSTKEQLQEHKKSAHPTDFIVQYQCMECKSCFSSKTILAEHQYLHSMEKLKKCDLCSREFNSLPQLKKHRDVHVCKGIVQCSSCSRWCMDDAELASHVCKTKMHKFIGSRIYFCDICVKDFKSDEKMFAHRNEHKKYYQCGNCFLEVDSEEEYFEHRAIHSFFTCTTCCEELKSETDLETHKKAHDFYVKVDLTQESDDSGDDSGDQPVMYLCPNLLNSLDV